MEEVLTMKIDPATAAAMTITAASAVAEHWLASNATAAAYLQAGWLVAVEVIVTGDPVVLQISFVDVDGTRYTQARVALPV
jgi:predicted membrane-bound mannosyltransferase